MNIFDKIAENEQAQYLRLGVPSTSAAFRDGRMTAMRFLAGGKGFRTESKEPERLNDKGERDKEGTTRGERKRAARAIANAKVSEYKEKQYMHSHARRNIDEGR